MIEAETRDRLIEQFRACLDSGEEVADEGRTLDLSTLLAEMAALKNEVRLQARQFKTALEQMQAAGEVLREHNARLLRDLERSRSQAADAKAQAQRGLLLGLLDLRDRLQAALDAQAARRPSPIRRLLGGERRFARSLREGSALTLQRLDELLANHRVRAISSVGQALDPQCMRAVAVEWAPQAAQGVVLRDGRVEVIPVSGALRIMPSVVGIGDDGALLVGEAARNQYAVHPQRTVRSIKRRMGEDVRVTMGDKDYAPQEISAMILRRLKSLAQTHLGHDVSKAVITVPAFFSDAQRQATREAGEIAGLEVVRIINEPTAAALAYESRHQGARKALVYDLGGGTFDVSVVNLEGDVVEVLASHGNNHLGGDDFDRKLVDLALAHLKQAHGVDASTSPGAMARLQRAAEAAKIALSERPFAMLTEEYLLEHEGVPLHLALEVSREQYEAMIEPSIAETLDAVHVALSGAALAVADIDEILLVGGATRTPLVARRLEEELGKQPRAEVDPDLCVAMGAAIQAALIAGTQTHTVLVDITPYTFGTSALGELDGEPYEHCFVPLIRKNTPIPVSRSDVFFTVYDGQQAVEVSVFQGEAPDALDNIEIGRFRIEGLSAVSAGNPIVLGLSLDLDGILEVTAREKKSGLERSITIDNAIARFEQDQLAEARNRVQALFGQDDEAARSSANDEAAEPGDKSAADARRLGVEARALVEKAERMLDQLGVPDAEDLVDAIEAVKDTLAGDDAALKAAMDTLADLLYYLEV